jgi:hypothetical protein
MRLKVILAVFASCEELAPSLLIELIDLSGISENPGSGHHEISVRPGLPRLSLAYCVLDQPEAEAGTRLEAGVVDAGARRHHFLRGVTVTGCQTFTSWSPARTVVMRGEPEALPARLIGYARVIVDSGTDIVILRTGGGPIVSVGPSTALDRLPSTERIGMCWRDPRVSVATGTIRACWWRSRSTSDHRGGEIGQWWVRLAIVLTMQAASSRVYNQSDTGRRTDHGPAHRPETRPPRGSPCSGPKAAWDQISRSSKPATPYSRVQRRPLCNITCGSARGHADRGPALRQTAPLRVQPFRNMRAHCALIQKSARIFCRGSPVVRDCAKRGE